ncbi:16800_t:CDS:2 [Gigaspora rosea]|nr:16800_t:CDS:2 [Gigaspora rosea]
MSSEFGSHLGSEKGGCYRKRRLSKIPAPVIIPPPSPTVTVPSPVSPASDSYLELQSQKTPQSPTKRFVLRPITALTAAFQRTSITGRNKSTLLKFQKSNNSPKTSKPTSPKPSPQSPKPPKSPKLLHRKGSSGSIRKRSDSPTTSTPNATFIVPNSSQPSPTTQKPSFLFGKSPFSLSINSPSSQSSKPPSRLGKFNIRHPKSSTTCRKALPITPAELAERLRDSSSQQHIRESFNVNLPTLLIKRYRRGNMNNFSLVSFITTPEGRDKYIDRVQDDTSNFNHDVIIFDGTMDENDKVSPGWTLLGVLERAMLNYHYNSSSENIDQTNDAPKGRVYWLRGGFEAFKTWDQHGEFLVTGPDVGAFSDNDHNSSLMDLEGQEQPKSGAGLVRRDSLFSVNTEQNSLRRKLSDRQQNNQIEENQQPVIEMPVSKDSEVLKRRRPSNGLQYLFTSANGDKRLCEPLYLPNNGDNYANNQLSAVNTDLDGNNLDSPNTSPPITHPEIAFVVSTIIPGFLYLGPEISKQEEMEELESKGIKRILNMAFECTDTLGLNEKFDQYLKLNVKDSVEEDVENGLKRAVAFIEQAEKDDTPIYVHCKAGKSRSVTAVLAFLIESRHWTLNQAYDYVMNRRSGICPNIGFVAELMKVEEGVFGVKKNKFASPELDMIKREMEGVETRSTFP